MLSRSPWERFRSDRRAVACLLILCAELLAVLLLPPLLGLEPNASDLGAGFWAPPSAAHPLGTDDVGRDLLARLLCGGRVSLLIGLCSNGVHSNGFSLVRKIFDIDGDPAVLKTAPAELGGKTLGEALLAPTKIYVQPVLKVLEEVDVKGISHITGGGFYENLPRSLKNGCCARIKKEDVRTPALFQLMQKTGNISEHDMFNTFNMGVGMVLTVPAEQADKALDILHANGEPEAYRLGVIAEGEGVELC